MASERVAILLRLPKDLRERIGEVASKNDRTTTAEIVNRLRRSLEAEGARQAQG